MWPSVSITTSAPGTGCCRSSIPRLPAPLSTLRPWPYGQTRMTRGRVWFATPSPYRTCTYSPSPVRLAHYGPAVDVKEKSFVPRLGTDAVMYPVLDILVIGCCPRLTGGAGVQDRELFGKSKRVAPDLPHLAAWEPCPRDLGPRGYPSPSAALPGGLPVLDPGGGTAHPRGT